MGITSIAYFMIPFDGSAVNVALPYIAHSLHASLSTLIWIPTVYLLVFATLETTMGRLGDIRGKRNLFIITLVIFTAGSLFAGLSASIGQLILARIVQGLGGAGMDAIGLSIITGAFPEGRRGRAFGLNSMVVYIGLTSGPALGGLLVQYLGWRSLFYVNIPIGIVAVVLSILFIQKDATEVKSRQQFDVLGAVTLAGFLITVLLILNGHDFVLPEIGNILLYTSCILFIIGFIYVEERVSQAPLLDLHLFTRNRLFAGGSATALMNYLTVFGTLFVLSVYLQSILGYSPLAAGLILLPQPIFMAISAPIAGALSDRISAQVLSSIGMGLKTIAFLFLATLGTNSSIVSIAIPLVVVGIGHGFFSSPNVNSVMGSVTAEKFGIASGTMGTIRQSGQSIGIAVLGGIVASHLPVGSLNIFASTIILNGVLASDFVSGVRIAFIAAAVICGIGIFTSLMRGKQKGPRK